MKRPHINLSTTRGIMVKIMMVMAIMVIFFGIVLKLIERSKDPLRQGVQQYLSEMSGYDVGIDALVDVSFIPNVRFHLKNILFRDKDNKEKIDAKIGDLDFSMPIWALMLGQTKFRMLSVTNAEAKEGVWAPYAVSLKNISLTEEEKTTRPVFTATGKYDGKPMNFNMGMEKSKGGLYHIPDNAALSFTVGHVTLNGLYETHRDAPFIKDAVLTGNGKTYGPATLEFKKNGTAGTDILSCLLAQKSSIKLNDQYPCVALFVPKGN